MSQPKLPSQRTLKALHILWFVPFALTAVAATGITDQVPHFESAQVTDINLVLGAALMSCIGFSSWIVKKYIKTSEDYIKNVVKMNSNLERLVNELEKRPCGRNPSMSLD